MTSRNKEEWGNEDEENEEEGEKEDEDKVKEGLYGLGLTQMFGYPWICQWDPRGDDYLSEEEDDKKEEEGEKNKEEEEEEEEEPKVGKRDVLLQATGYVWNGQVFFIIPREDMRLGNWQKAQFCAQDE